jgi:cytochrome bd-type quinol oxidase subunit 2
MSELIFILLFFGIPGIFGFIMAHKRRKNPYLWGFLCAIFPFFLMVLKMQYKPQDKKSTPG